MIYSTKEELRSRGGILDSIMDTAFEQAILVDESLHILWCSKNAARMYGYSQGEPVGMHIMDISRSDKSFERVIRTGLPVRNRIHNNSGKKALQSVFPIIDRKSHELIGALGTISLRGHDFEKLLSTPVPPPQARSVANLSNDYYAKYGFDDFAGDSLVIRQLIRECRVVAKSMHPILIVGETGCGKEIIASSIHLNNPATANYPYIRINCTAIPDSLLESELFGYEKGAFTGASGSKVGKFEQANGGTILLDEIGDMHLSLQAKLLRVLAEKEFERVGGNRLIPLNARIIASTNKNLLQMCEEGKFRLDLYYRLSTFEVMIPPLRDRPEDVLTITEHTVQKNDYDFCLMPDALEYMRHHHWPGNVRQLQNLLYKLSVVKSGQPVFRDDLPKVLSTAGQPVDSPAPPKRDAGNSGRGYSEIIDALAQTNMNMTEAARLLCISRRTLYNKVKLYGIKINRVIKA